MVWSEGSFVNFQSAFVGGFGPGVVAQGLQHAAQVVDANSNAGMVRAEGSFADLQGAFVGGFGPGVVAQVLQH